MVFHVFIDVSIFILFLINLLLGLYFFNLFFFYSYSRRSSSGDDGISRQQRFVFFQSSTHEHRFITFNMIFDLSDQLAECVGNTPVNLVVERASANAPPNHSLWSSRL